MAVRKLSGGYYTRKGDYIWVWVLVQPGEETDLVRDNRSGYVKYIGSMYETSTAELKEQTGWGSPSWKKEEAMMAHGRGAWFRRQKWRKVKDDKVPLVWRKFLNRFK